MIRLRINQPTPCGGAYSELFYLNNPIENKNLPTITVIIQEYDLRSVCMHAARESPALRYSFRK